jgi:hypothetical protein
MNTEAWDFVVANLQNIQSIARQRRFQRNHIEADELVSEVCALAAQKYASYDPQRGTPRQWLYQLTMWAMQRNERRYRPGDYQFEDANTEATGWGSVRHQEQERTIREIQTKTTGKARASVDSVLAEMSAAEVEAELGMTNGNRNWYIRNLNKTLEARF